MSSTDDTEKQVSPAMPKTAVPEIRIEHEKSETNLESDPNKFQVSHVKERKISGKEPSLTGISEDGSVPEETGRIRKVSIMVGPEGEPIRHYIPARKISSSEHHFLTPYGRAAAPGRKSSMDAFFVQQHQRMSVVSVMSSNQDTFEALPHVDHYRDLFSVFPNDDVRQRPTLDELRDEEPTSPRTPNTPSIKDGLFADELKDVEDGPKPSPRPSVTSGALKFGWIQGVLVRCLLNIFGVMLFLRLTWVTGQAGIGLASIVVLLSAFVTIITTTSMSAICTNGEVKGGGAYYMISRSLGPEFGGSIGIVFSLANAIAAAMYIVGFAETVQSLMMEFDTTITGDRMHDVRIIGCATSVLLVGIVIIGMEWEAKAQMGLLVILTIAIINFVVGTFIPPTEEKQLKGFVGYNADVFSENFGPAFRDGNSFFTVFSIFFPAATGILAGANISGDLKNPQKAIPKGTFLAIFLTTLVYLAMLWIAGSCIMRDAVGPVAMEMIANVTNNVTVIPSPVTVPSTEVVRHCDMFNKTCEYGLMNDNGAVGVASAFRPLILAGIFSATLSSALASLVGAPKVFQALGKDKLFPFIEFFAKGYGRSSEPRRGYLLAFFICVAMTCIGALDLIAPIISNFFLMAYALINYSCFDASIAGSPGFRPAFRFYNKWTSLLGALICLAVMFLINWWSALITFVFVCSLYMYVKIKKPDVNWGSSTQAHVYREALKSSMKLIKMDEHVKNFRPQVLVLSGYPRNRPQLIDFVACLTKRQSLLMCGHIFRGELSDHVKNLRSNAAYKWFERRSIKAFYNSVVTPTLRIGAQVLMQAVGIGKLRPNTIIMGYKSDWQKADGYEVDDYYNIIQDAFDLNYGVGILRVPEGLDLNKVPDDCVGLDDDIESDHEQDTEQDIHLEVDSQKSPTISTGHSDIPGENTENESSYKFLNSKPKVTPPKNHVVLQRLNTVEEGAEENNAYVRDQGTHLGEEEERDEARPTHTTLLSTLSCDSNAERFREKQYGTIDVWWLYDDGGLTLLIPYILSTRRKWKDCKLRVFCAGTKHSNPNEDQMRMASLLAKFRIEYSQLTVIPDLWKKPSLNMYKEFESTIRKWRLRGGEYPDEFPWKISESDMVSNKAKIYRNIRLREQLLIHSTEASLIVMTLPVPRKAYCPAGLYMGWLETLTRDMPPMLLLRGNQQSVLTYYS
ncbi:solute carrier family 12 member 3-like [Mizuhopecten yessoensis]|uniref:Solute carrier family 12 member 2 n=1 Tax=Mizuhopecten yessoensis TaxID=6573 RepID=A0A210R6Q4_MIZYE|nr:solute carrier family 12 member 3-like [Mizuhopecten yessoensis]OWF56733.1 Solute carrier family 12 member 2 [Mizuhopecten yessoensis]